MPELTLVAAMDQARAIGVDGGLPWHLPADLKHFKRTTLGHSVLMGRKTFEEVKKPLPGRQNIILSRSLQRPPTGCELAATLGEALGLATSEEIMVIGGGEIYRATLARATRMVITHVDTRVQRADTWFPRISSRRWSGWDMATHAADDNNEFSFVVREYLPRVVDDKVLCRTPSAGKKPTRIPLWKFDLLRTQILAVLSESPDPVPFRNLVSLVGPRLKAADLKRLGSLGWHTTCVKLELEVAGEIQRVAKASPQLLVPGRS